MRFPLISCGLAMLLSVATWLSAAPEGDPAERLQTLVARQRELLAAAERKTSQNELEDLRQPLQELCFAYEDYLRAFPDQAAGYASYALLLDHPIIDERRRSTALFLRANQLNPEMALVKNQLGNHLAEDGKPLEAVNYYLAAIRLEPKESLYHYQLGTLLAEARDRKRGPENATLTLSNNVVNRQEAERALRSWAGQLKKTLDSARSIQ